MKFFVFSFVIIIFWSTTFFAFGAEMSVPTKYTPIVGIPGLDMRNELTTEGYVNVLYLLAITVSALLAVIKIIFAGVKYTLSDVVTDKGSAIKDIKGALLGLLIVLSAVLILNTINTDLTKLKIFGDSAPGLDLNGTGAEVLRRQELEYPIVRSRFTGEFGSQAHTSFVTNCRNGGGIILTRSNSGNSGSLKCRGK